MNKKMVEFYHSNEQGLILSVSKKRRSETITLCYKPTPASLARMTRIVSGSSGEFIANKAFGPTIRYSL